MFSGSKSLKSPRAKLTPQKTVSFRVYELEQKTRLKALYPFLSADQIKKKIKDQWGTLTQEDKNKYTKVTLKATPVKGKQKSPKAEKYCNHSRKRKKSSENVPNKKPRLEVCATPEFINTEKLHDFRQVHAETYDNDFSDLPTSQESLSYSPHYDWTTKGTVTYQNVGSSVDRMIPQIIDNTPYNQAGILKSRENAEQGAVKAKGRVSFNSPTNIYQLSDHVVYSEQTSDEENDGLLIRRDEHGLELLQRGSALRYSYDSDDEDDSALLITRPDEECENTEMDDNEVDKGRGVAAQPENNPVETIQAQQGENVKTTDYSKTIVKDTQVGEEKVDKNLELFKSPLPDMGTNNKRPRRGRKITKKDEKSAEVRTPVGSFAKISNLVTPTVPRNFDTLDNYTTPQMDEVLQQHALEVASKAPQKRRQSAPNTTDLEKLRALTSGRRVTRSLIACQEAITKMSSEQMHSTQGHGSNLTDRIIDDNKHDFENACNLMDPSGDARSTVSRQRKEQLRTETTTNLANFKDVKHAELMGQNRSQEMKQSSSTSNISEQDKSIVTVTNKTENDSPVLKFENMVHRSLAQHTDESFISMSDYSSTDSQSSEIQSSPLVDMIENSNPVLEKALRNLRCTTSGSPKLFTNERVTRSSPVLLSPALSGVSELSSASSLSVDDGETENKTVMKQAEEEVHLREVERKDKNSLCQMFKDVTPPDKKTRGMFKTLRKSKKSIFSLSSAESAHGMAGVKQYNRDKKFQAPVSYR